MQKYLYKNLHIRSVIRQNFGALQHMALIFFLLHSLNIGIFDKWELIGRYEDELGSNGVKFISNFMKMN
jgi:hypothetical protein